MAKKKFELNRKDYLNIKKMDHHQMSLWAESMYKSGFEDGQASVPGLDISLVKKALLSVKGIGEKKAADIIIAIEKETTE
nr:MAG TPA: putative DNA-3-methyladenine glycosylase 2 [Caudoviricetes sp.]